MSDVRQPHKMQNCTLVQRQNYGHLAYFKQWKQRSLTKRTDKLQTKKQLPYWPLFMFHLLGFNAMCLSWRTQKVQRRVFCPKDGYSIFFQNRGNILRYYLALKPKYGLLWKHRILKFQWLDIHAPDYRRQNILLHC